MSGVKQGQAFPQMRRLSLSQDDVRVDGPTALQRVVGGARQVSGRGLCSDIWAFEAGAVVETVDADKAYGGLMAGFEERYGGRAGAWKIKA